MKTMKASEAKTKFGLLMDLVAKEPVLIEKHGRPYAVMICKDRYDHIIDICMEKNFGR
jgi:prevent-host-death family protein